MSVSKFDNTIDSLDVIKRIEELESERKGLVSNLDEAKETLSDASDDTSAIKEDRVEISNLKAEVEEAEEAIRDWDSENTEELSELKALQDECEGYSDWIHGETLIADEHFQDYAQELAEDLGMDRNQPWPYSCIDWEAAADALKQDYNQVDFGGYDFWIRG